MKCVSTRRGTMLGVLVVVSIVGLGACAAEPEGESSESSADAYSSTDPNWPCYNPAPGHPTAAEKEEFIAVNGAAAQDAERRYGVPAAALLAMATNEGGYGFTRTAIYAKNSFGWKYYGAASAGGRPSYTLACQPAFDVGKDYIKFGTIAEGILFVGQKLSTLPNYAADAKKYVADRRAGVDTVTAVNRFIDGIAEPYNYDPPTYRAAIKRHANDYMNPSAVRSPTHSLYSYSAVISYASP